MSLSKYITYALFVVGAAVVAPSALLPLVSGLVPKYI